MSAFWIDFEAGGKSGCVEADNAAEATRIAVAARGPVRAIRSLPYPADPRINTVDHPTYGVCPSFCYTPTRCAGATACPKPYSCVE